MACHVTKININKQPTKQNLITLFNKNLKAFETNEGYLYKKERRTKKKKYMKKYKLQI